MKMQQSQDDLRFLLVANRRVKQNWTQIYPFEGPRWLIL